MSMSNVKHPRSLRWLVGGILPLLLVAAIAIGSISVFGAHAASGPSSHYNFRGITTSGTTGIYLAGSMVLTIDVSGNVTGNVCGLKIGIQRCTPLSGTATSGGSSITLTLSRLSKGYGQLVLTGTAVNTSGNRGGFNGYEGTFTLGASQGTWEARTSAFPLLSGSWNTFGLVEQGADVNKQFHGVLTLIQKSNGQLSGTYCPLNGTCSKATGGKNAGNFYFYVDITLFGQVIRLQGSSVNSTGTRISGQFESLNPNSKTADRGYWLGH